MCWFWKSLQKMQPIIGSQKCTAGKNYCLECSENEKLCKECEYGFYPDENGGCSYSKDCKISLKGECLECKQDFVLINKNGMCKSTSSDDFKNCKKITPGLGECEECEDGYYLDGGDKKCTKTKNCYESIFGVCHTCNSGFFLDKRVNECKEKYGIFMFCKQILDGKTCDLCDDGAHLDQNDNCVDTDFVRNQQMENVKNAIMDIIYQQIIIAVSAQKIVIMMIKILVYVWIAICTII